MKLDKIKKNYKKKTRLKGSDIFDKCKKYIYARELIEKGYYPYFTKFESAQGPEVVVNGKRMIMLGSNDYLGLSTHPAVKKKAEEILNKYGTSCCGSRFLNGTTNLHEELEKKIAGFIGKQASILFSTGFQTNLGVISALVGRNDIVIIDELSHASIIDGCRLSFGQTKKFRHNDMKDLERILTSLDLHRGKFIVSEGVFSMDGDIVNLPEMVYLAKKYNARIMIDDAHSIGVLGGKGRGTLEHFGLEDEVDLVMGTCSKSLVSIGGFIAGDEEVIHYLKHHARSLIFSASLPTTLVASISSAIDIIDKEPERLQKLWENVKKMQRELKTLGFNIGKSETPIIPIIIGDNFKVFQMCKLLFINGVFVNPVIIPAVPAKQARIRTTYMATHTDEHLDKALEVFEKCGKECGLI